MKFESTEIAGKEIVGSGDLARASVAMRKKNYKKAYYLYRGIVDRGGKTITEGIASKQISWFYENGVGVEKNIEFAQEMKNRAEIILDEKSANP